MTMPAADPKPVDPDFAVHWYQGWIEAWNERQPDLIPTLVTEDFLLDSPTTRHTGWPVQGHAATVDYLSYVIGAYPDLMWEVTAPPMFRGDLARFKCPSSVDVVDALPHTATGKVVKPVLRERYWQGHDRRIH